MAKPLPAGDAKQRGVCVEELQCAICLDVLSFPVTLPCGWVTSLECGWAVTTC